MVLLSFDVSWILLLTSAADMAVSVSPVTGFSVVETFVGLSLAVCVRVGAEASSRAFLGQPRGFGLLVGSLRLRLDRMG